MSLAERVKKAEKAGAIVNDRDTSRALSDFKNELNERISSAEIARLMQQSPLRAKNEIKSVCACVFEETRWQSYGSLEREEMVSEVLDSVFGFGPLESMLNDESVTEIMVNGAKAVFFERKGRLYRSDHLFVDDDEVRTLIDRIIGPLGRRIDEASPMVNARLKQGHRVNAIIPPLALDGPILTIRKFREHTYTLDEMLSIRSIDSQVERFLELAVRLRKNIAVSGGTGSGKTTLLNALSCKISPEERIITIEDSAELRFSRHPHVVRLEARPRNAEGTGEVAIRDLVVNSLRMRPDRIIVGECRGGEALDMLQAMNTGHDGSLTTLHANSSADAVMRLTTMVRYAADLPVGVIEAQIASAIDVIIQTTRALDGRRYVEEIAQCLYQRELSKCEVMPLYRRSEAQGEGAWSMVPEWITECAAGNDPVSKEVRQWMEQLSWD